ncbi:MAG: SDR family NAD(P)-dependent oxidoreductase, partial [Actinobacteria bacterium]|nr:SDR family NAD(P)-dependent oxidoreductase [Actinomycetota bacterium]
MAGRLEGKVAVITGGARGIGAGMVERFIAEGARCVISDIQHEVGVNFTAQFGDKAIFIQADVASENDVKATVDAAVAH